MPIGRLVTSRDELAKLPRWPTMQSRLMDELRETTMNTDHSEIALLSEEEMRNVRLARGLRAVAASVIVGGLLVIAVETMLPAGRSVAVNAPAMQIPEHSLPLVAPAAQPGAAPATDTADPLLRRLEEGVIHHG